MPKPERMPENHPSDENPPILKKREGVYDARHYQEYAARAEAREAEEKIAKPVELKAIRPRKLEAIREGAAIKEALEKADLWKTEREQRQKIIEQWAHKNFWGLPPQAVADKLEELFNPTRRDAASKKGFLSDVSEGLHHLRQLEFRDNPLVKDMIAGMEEFLADQTVVVSPEAKATWKKLKAEKQAAEEQAKRAAYAHEMPAAVNPNAETQPDMAAITPKEQDWFDKGDRGDVTDDEDDNLGGGMVGRLAGRH